MLDRMGVAGNGSHLISHLLITPINNIYYQKSPASPIKRLSF